jgi:hypothetical protein
MHAPQGLTFTHASEGRKQPCASSGNTTLSAERAARVACCSSHACGGIHVWTSPHESDPQCRQCSVAAGAGLIDDLEAYMCSPCSALQLHMPPVACGRSAASQPHAHRVGSGRRTPSCCTCFCCSQAASCKIKQSILDMHMWHVPLLPNTCLASEHIAKSEKQ